MSWRFNSFPPVRSEYHRRYRVIGDCQAVKSRVFRADESFMTKRMTRSMGVAVGLASLFAGCGTAGVEPEALTDRSVAVDSTATPVSNESTTVSSPATTSPSAPSTTAAIVTSTAPTPPPTAADQGLNPLGGNAPEDFLMPNVLCMNLQEAQDEIQDHGVFYSRSEDATGGGRMQLNDSNWQVVAQFPDPGNPIGEGDANLSVVKFGEQPNPC